MNDFSMQQNQKAFSIFAWKYMCIFNYVYIRE